MSKTLDQLKKEMDSAKSVYDAADVAAEVAADANDAADVAAWDAWVASSFAANAYHKKLKESTDE